MRIIAWSSDVCSSDLCRRSTAWFMGVSRRGMRLRPHPRPNRYLPDLDTPRASRARDLPIHGEYSHRSEEHTSELQSLMRISYAVFCLKNKTKKTNTTQHTKSYCTNKNTNNKQNNIHTNTETHNKP